MTEVAFHFNVPDKLAYGCRLLRKAWGSGARVIVTAEPDTLERLDLMLWTFSALEFVPHCRQSAPVATLAASPVLLASTLADCPHHEVLVNLGQGVPPGFERFERFIELVTVADADRAAARSRWKHYTDRGYAMKRHDLASA
ncbi:MAG: DNA polymerase III subunit chi [Polaromonas sp.]|uniref:DNA polymerase III subunit chi n=1 Tax=Polaromonas sp. TaxID=1869339 RepID=UPI00272FC8E0|nr:DNA polymerase III subunit chi [Polaromonas sp.]MDP1739550.1 DNA polymerase III subunit chi [Polaromonas sp.]MDP1953156.1 DNA polymerase III subunit chi [Polaromonas sp.]MDP3355926.1 DNA polymerase III subunit chi [Polaromonas sp.]MDP3752980.1 DNA polymerase III subunit chi [Polaromonas sp.]